MRTGHRPAALLAVICLILSPAAAAAAAPNQLLNGSVSPGSGTTLTTFGFAVDYSSERGFEATSVVALVAGRSVPLGLVSGTATAGTYQGSDSLPIGSWPVTFEAQATQGPTATLSGPTVVVSAPPPPPEPVAPMPSTPAPTPQPPAPTLVATPAPRPPVTKPTQTPSAAGTPIPSIEPPEPSAAPSADRSAAQPPSSASPSDSPALGAGAAGSLSPRGSDGPDAPLGWIAVIGSVVAAVSILAWWRRRPDHGGEETVAAALRAAQAEPIALAARAGQRQAAVAADSEDPILAAMGLGAGRADRPVLDAPLSRRVRSGPGERPSAGTSRNRRAG